MSAMVRGLKFIVITLAAYGRKVLLFILLFYCNAPAACRRYHVPRAASCRSHVPRKSVTALYSPLRGQRSCHAARFHERRVAATVFRESGVRSAVFRQRSVASGSANGRYCIILLVARPAEFKQYIHAAQRAQASPSTARNDMLRRGCRPRFTRLA